MCVEPEQVCLLMDRVSVGVSGAPASLSANGQSIRECGGPASLSANGQSIRACEWSPSKFVC